MKKLKIVFILFFFTLTFFSNFFKIYASVLYIKNNTNQKQKSDNIKSISIIVIKIDKYYIYAKDGRKFPISSTTKIINNSANANSKIRIATLIFKNNKLIAVILK